MPSTSSARTPRRNFPRPCWNEHCAEYGFILRYPEGREEYTGRDPEPGHFRYVGEVAAEYIMRKGITLEEFKDAYDESKNDPWAKKDDK